MFIMTLMTSFAFTAMRWASSATVTVSPICTSRLTGAAGRSHHELLFGDDGLVMLGQMGPSFRSLRDQGVDSPVMVHVYVDDVVSLHERAKAAGAEITELEIAPVGDQRFTATDPEGISWVFAQRLSERTR